MKITLRYLRSGIAIIIIVSLVFLFNKCIHKNNVSAGPITNNAGQQFAGSTTCITCHKNIYDTHVQTAHFSTSRIAKKKYIAGSFENDSNKFAYNDHETVAMEQEDSSLYQVAYINGIRKAAHRFDIIVGSGAMGQTFLNWKDNQLFQLPITYFTAAKQWSNSPGYPNRIIYDRPVTARCLECHSTFAKVLAEPETAPAQFDRNQIIYGVDCEKCHGPAAEHVAFQTKNPTVTKAQYIVNPARLSRQQNLGLCASCHGGRLQKIKPSFNFAVGDTLANYFVVDTTAADANNIDVHGNQYGLLRASKCFKASQAMTCSNCHNTHENERGNTALYSQRCMGCHTVEHGNFCTIKIAAGMNIKSNCIDCHMPLKPSKAIAVFLPDATAPLAAMIRSHFISIYPDETRKLIAFIKKSK